MAWDQDVPLPGGADASCLAVCPSSLGREPHIWQVTPKLTRRPGLEGRSLIQLCLRRQRPRPLEQVHGQVWSSLSSNTVDT